MLIPKKVRQTVYSYLFREGVLVAKHDLRIKHAETDVDNLYVLHLMRSLKSKKLVRESFTWNHHYFYLENDGIVYLREYLHLTEDVVPATLKKKTPVGGERPGRGDRFGDRPRRFEDKEGPGSDFKPSFRAGGRGRPTDQ